jgi:hypothetical protein
MPLNRLYTFTTLMLLTSLIIVASSCKKDIDATTTSKCDYAPYSKGSRLTHTTTSSSLIETDTIVSDTIINGVGYVKALSTRLNSSGDTSIGTSFLRCDANGVYQKLANKSQIGITGVTDFTPIELQGIKLPASVGLAWQSDSFKFSTNQGINVATIYKMQITALGGSKTINGTVYANNLVTVQFKTISKTLTNGIARVDSSVVFNVFDKTYGIIERTQNGVVIRSLKTALIR